MSSWAPSHPPASHCKQGLLPQRVVPHCPSGDPYPKATGPLGLKEGTLQVVSSCLSPNPLTPTPSDRPTVPTDGRLLPAPGREAGKRKEPACLPATPLSSLLRQRAHPGLCGRLEDAGGINRPAPPSPHLMPAHPAGTNTSEPRGGALPTGSPAPQCVCVCVCPQHPWWRQRSGP